MNEPAYSVVRQEPDHVPWKVVALVFALTTALSVGLALLAWFIGASDSGADGRDQATPGPREHETVLEGEVPAERERARRMERLDAWEWVDRRQEIVHVPIEEAMRLRAAQEVGS